MPRTNSCEAAASSDDEPDDAADESDAFSLATGFAGSLDEHPTTNPNASSAYLWAEGEGARAAEGQAGQGQDAWAEAGGVVHACRGLVRSF